MINEKNKIKEEESVKADKKMPELDLSKKTGSQKSEEIQDPKKSSHQLSNDDKHESSKANEPKSKSY